MSAAMHTNARGHGPVPRDAGSAGQQHQAGALPARDRGNLPRREGVGRRLAHSDAAGQRRPAPTSCAAREAANEVRVVADSADSTPTGACRLDVSSQCAVPAAPTAPASATAPGRLLRRITAGEAVHRLLRAANGGVVTRRLIEAALAGLGLTGRGTDAHAIAQARRRAAQSGAAIERVTSVGYRLRRIEQ